MIAIDTNVLVRMLIDDKQQQTQCAMARELATIAKQVFISQIVQIEVIWVLKRVYKLSKEQLLSVLDMLVQNPDFHLEVPLIFEQAVNTYRNATADFSDYMVLVTAIQHHQELWTFDKKLSKSPHTNRLDMDTLQQFKLLNIL